MGEHFKRSIIIYTHALFAFQSFISRCSSKACVYHKIIRVSNSLVLIVGRLALCKGWLDILELHVYGKTQRGWRMDLKSSLNTRDLLATLDITAIAYVRRRLDTNVLRRLIYTCGET